MFIRHQIHRSEFDERYWDACGIDCEWSIFLKGA